MGAPSGVARKTKDGLDNSLSRSRDQPRKHVEIGTELGTKHRQDEDQAHHDLHAKSLEPSERAGQYVRQQTNGNSAAIERRQRQHVEHGKDHVEVDCIHKILKEPEPSINTARQKADKVRH